MISAFEAAPGNGRFFSQPTMKLLGQANADHPTPGVFHPRKASDGRSKRDPDNQSGHSGKGDGHGDTPTDQEQHGAKRLLANISSIDSRDYWPGPQDCLQTSC
jgi:hypothetical protein